MDGGESNEHGEFFDSWCILWIHNETRYYKGSFSDWCGSKGGKWSEGHRNGTTCSGCGGNCTAEWNNYAYGFTFRRSVSEVLWNNGTAKALPPGIFLICGDRAWQGVPANPLGGPCYLGKLTMFAPNHTGWLNISRFLHPHRCHRDVSPGPECNDDVKLWSVTACMFASIFAPGVSAAAALTQIERLACWSAKQANTTTLVLNAMLEDLNSVRHALLQNRAAIDFLLLAQGHECEDVEGMCCFNLSGHSMSIHKQLRWMQEHTQKIKEESDPFGNWLNRLFRGVGSWLKQLLKVFVIGLAIFVCILICLPCFVGCLQNSLQ
eukprot:XP_004938710.1 endogenous retrovirus group PABLB member 1 Env polyprotein [Gallus gallus]